MQREDAREPSSSLLGRGLAILTVLAACSAPHKLISSRHTSCPVRKIEIRNLVTQAQREDWIALCGERSFACYTRERGQRLIYGCRALADAGAADAAPAAGPLGAPPVSSETVVDGGVAP